MPTITDYTVNNGNYQDDLRAGNIPPTFYTYGTEDPFYRQFIANANAARETYWTVGRTASAYRENGLHGSTVS